MVVGFVSLVLAGAFRTALLSSVPLVCKLVGNVLWRAVWLGELSCYGRKMGGSNEPPILGRFALPSVGVVRHRRRGAAFPPETAPGCVLGPQEYFSLALWLLESAGAF